MYSFDTFTDKKYTRNPFILLRRRFLNTNIIHNRYLWTAFPADLCIENVILPAEITDASNIPYILDFLNIPALHDVIKILYGTESCKFLTLALWRCYTANKYQATFKDTYNVQLYQDSHMMLLVWMVNNGKFEDADIPTNMYPNLSGVLHEGSLPDLVDVIYNCAFLNDITHRNLILHQWINKAIPHKCQIRSLNAVVQNNIHNSAKFAQILTKMNFCSLIGGYYSCNSRVGLGARFVLYTSYYNIMGNIYSDSKFRSKIEKWYYTNDRYIHYVSKEYMLFLINQDPSYKKIVTMKYQWDVFENIVKNAMDSIRRHVALSDFSTPIWKSVYDIIFQYKIRHNNIVMKLPRLETHKWMLIDMSELITKSNIVLRYIDLKKLANLVRSMPMVVDECNFIWLASMGCSMDFIAIIFSIEELYKKGKPRPGLKKQLGNLCRTYPQDFYIGFLLLKRYYYHSHIRILDLPYQYIPLQLKALREKWRKQDPYPLPEETSVIYICTSCKSLKCNIVPAIPNYKEMYCFIYTEIVHDSLEDKLYCGKTNDDTTAKRSKNKNDGDVAKTKIVGTTKCRDTELEPVNALGKVIVIFDEAFMICPLCACIFKIQNFKYKYNIMWCGSCPIAYYTTYWKNWYIKYNSDIMEHIEKKIRFSYQLPLACGDEYQTYKKAVVITCARCATVAKKNSVFHKVNVLNDETKSTEFETMIFCGFCFDYNIFSNPANMFKSTLWKALDQRPLLMYAHGYRQFVK